MKNGLLLENQTGQHISSDICLLLLAIPLFRKYQNDAKSSAAQIVNFLSGQMGKKELVYDNFDVFSSSPKPYILLGETFETEIALGAFSSQAEFSVRVGGSNLKIEEGKAKYTTRPTSIGEKTYTAQITVKNPLTGKEETFTKKISNMKLDSLLSTYHLIK